MSTLSDVTVLVTTFLRDGYLRKCLTTLASNVPECTVVVVDDGYPSAAKDSLPHYERLPFDSGLSAKRNAGVRACRTKYLLLGCDDFDFAAIGVRDGIEKLLNTLDSYPEIDVASGRVNNYAYEGMLEYKPGQYIRQSWLDAQHTAGPALCDITVNYFLMRVDSLREVAWDARMKIGGEHGDWFLSLKEAGKKVAWVPGVNIPTLKLGDGPDVQHPDYRSYRERAHGLGHRVFLEKRGVPHMIGFNGEIL